MKKNKEKVTFFDKLIDGFVKSFGSKTHFVLACFGAAYVVYMIFDQGYNNWLLTTGLASNNWESAIEYFLAVATLYQAARIMVRQETQSIHLQKETDEIDAISKEISDRLDTGTPGGIKDIIDRLDNIEKMLKKK